MTILQQQLELEFGEKFSTVKAKATSYVKGLIGKDWWRDRKVLLTSEGPLESMVEQCLMFIIEKGDVIEGYRAYTSHLTQWYGTSTGPNQTDLIDTNLGANESVPTLQNWTTMGEWSNGAAPLGEQAPSEENVGVKETPTPDWLSLEQADFLLAYEKASPADVAEFFGITQRQAREKRNTLVGNKRRQLRDT